MKALSKPLSSPSRSAEKFPPPLMRFLRSNPASRSRGRSRSSPIFYLRSKRRPPAGAIQEPSSPKVTCIGQVRVRRRKNNAADVNPRRRRCGWLRFPKKPFRKILRGWVSLLKPSCCGEGDKIRAEKGEKNEINCESNDRNSIMIRNVDSESDDYCSNNKHEEEKYRRDLPEPSSSSSSPPKNALLLTRCRSAPYRSSSLGGRFWGSPLSGENEKDENNHEPDEIENASACCGGESPKEKKIEDMKANTVTAGNAVHPLSLTRCKSEPARKGERLVVVNPEDKGNGLLVQARLDVVHS